MKKASDILRNAEAFMYCKRLRDLIQKQAQLKLPSKQHLSLFHHLN